MSRAEIVLPLHSRQLYENIALPSYYSATAYKPIITSWTFSPLRVPFQHI